MKIVRDSEATIESIKKVTVEKGAQLPTKVIAVMSDKKEVEKDSTWADTVKTDTVETKTVKVTVDGKEYDVELEVLEKAEAPKSSAKKVTATKVGTLEGTIVKDVPVSTKVSALKAALTVSEKAKVEIVGSDENAVADQGNTDVTADMKIVVTAEDGTTAEYTIALEAVKSSAKKVTATKVGTLEGTTVKDVPVSTKVSALKAALTVSEKAKVEIVGSDENAVADQGNTDVTADMKIVVTAEDGTTTKYTIALEAVKSSAKKVTATKVGTLEGTTVKDVPVSTKVSALKAALTVSEKAKVEIVGSDENAVADQGNTDVIADMKIVVTAEDGTTAEYTIALA